LRLIVFTDAEFPFRMFSVDHLVPLGLLLAAIAAMYLFRGRLRGPRLNLAARMFMAGVLVVAEASYHVWANWNGSWTPGYSLPLHICGLAALLSVVMLLTRSYAIFELVYFWGLAGTTQAILTPDLGTTSFPHYMYYKFFVFHSFIILAVLFMTIVERYRPTLRSLGKVVVLTNVYAVFIAVVDYVFDGNYLYLCWKPQGGSLLDYLGPWPWYIASLEIIVIVFCLICYLPYAGSGRKNRGGQAASEREVGP
jgi:hypothetical integral membrane protein (TIGR02206 family)